MSVRNSQNTIIFALIISLLMRSNILPEYFQQRESFVFRTVDHIGWELNMISIISRKEWNKDFDWIENATTKSWWKDYQISSCVLLHPTECSNIRLLSFPFCVRVHEFFQYSFVYFASCSYELHHIQHVSHKHIRLSVSFHLYYPHLVAISFNTFDYKIRLSSIFGCDCLISWLSKSFCDSNQDFSYISFFCDFIDDDFFGNFNLRVDSLIEKYVY